MYTHKVIINSLGSDALIDSQEFAKSMKKPSVSSQKAKLHARMIIKLDKHKSTVKSLSTIAGNIHSAQFYVSEEKK